MLITKDTLKEFVLEEYINILFEDKNIHRLSDLFQHREKLLYKSLLTEDLQGTIRNVMSTVQTTKNQDLIKLFNALITDENYKNFPNGDEDTFKRVLKLIDDQYKNILNNKTIASNRSTLRSNLFALRVILGFFVIQTHDQDRKQLMRDKVESYVPDNTQGTSQNTTTQSNQSTQQPQQQSNQTPQQQTSQSQQQSNQTPQQQAQPQPSVDYKDAYNDFYNKLPLTLDKINNIFKKQVTVILGPKKKHFSIVLSKISKDITNLLRTITDKEFAKAYSRILSSKQNIQEANNPRKVKNPVFKGNDLYNILNQIFVNRNFKEGVIGYLDSLIDKNAKALRLQQKQTDELKGLLRNAFGNGVVQTSTASASVEPELQQPMQVQDTDPTTQSEPATDQEPAMAASTEDQPQDQEPAMAASTEDQPQTDGSSTEEPTRQLYTAPSDQQNKPEKEEKYVDPFSENGEGQKYYAKYADIKDDEELKKNISKHIPDAQINIERRTNNKSYRLAWIKQEDSEEHALIYPPKLKVPRMLPNLTRMYVIDGKGSTVKIEQLPVLLKRFKGGVSSTEEAPLEDPYVILGKATAINDSTNENKNIIDKITNEFKYLLNEHNKFINDIHTENKNNAIEDKKINARFKQLAGIK